MENAQNPSLVRSYETPAVTYEAILVAHAGISSVASPYCVTASATCWIPSEALASGSVPSGQARCQG